ncbi:MAG: asparagine synthase (glutamine-hydrolyzing) [Phycisphaerae bacterium]|nr:asparagine synthase (glutamine-hydrolyzing) [Phycisphaerae bacterium]
MCGIAGILRFTSDGGEPEAIPDAWLDVLDRAIAHRGPDGAGRLRDRAILADGRAAEVALIHRRLTILDPKGGHQPMAWRGSNSREHAAILFNGLIYNHIDLRTALRAEGVVFSSDHSDTEALLHACRRWGVRRACERASDMFAFAYWDGRSLTLARDRFGQKPLYWCDLPDGRAFASCAAALRNLLRTAGVSAPPDPTITARWLRFGAWGDPPTRGLHSLPPGSTLNLTAPKPSAERYTPPAPARDRPLTLDALDHALRSAVHARLEADVPLGCFLSGGVDSALIASYAKERIPNLETFTVRMPDPLLDESSEASATAAALGTRHHTLGCSPRPAEDLVRLISLLGLPLGDSSLLPAHWLAREVRRTATTALSGDGGDDLFAGYDRHAAAARVGPWNRLLALWPIGPGSRPSSRRSRAARLADACRHDGYLDLVSVFPRSMLRTLGVEVPRETPVPWTVAEALSHDQARYLPDDLLIKSDGASMATALEVRSPFLDGVVADLSQRATIDSLMPGGRRKGLLRDLALRRLPVAVARRPKRGFAVPIGEWFRTDFGQMRTLLGDALHGTDPFPEHLLGLPINPAAARALMDEHDRRRRDHSQRLYTLLVLALWAADGR